MATEFTEISLHRCDPHINLSLSRPYLSAAANNFAVNVSETDDIQDELGVATSTSSVRVSLYIKCSMAYRNDRKKIGLSIIYCHYINKCSFTLTQNKSNNDN